LCRDAYKPSEQDLQALHQRFAQRFAALGLEAKPLDPQFTESSPPNRDAPVPERRSPTPWQAMLRTLEAGIAARVIDPIAQTRLLRGARESVANARMRAAGREGPDLSTTILRRQERLHGWTGAVASTNPSVSGAPWQAAIACDRAKGAGGSSASSARLYGETSRFLGQIDGFFADPIADPSRLAWWTVGGFHF
jgi:hypothetical protein